MCVKSTYQVNEKCYVGGRGVTMSCKEKEPFKVVRGSAR